MSVHIFHGVGCSEYIGELGVGFEDMAIGVNSRR